MIRLKYKKVHIIGSVGSGKTTLAKKLSKEFNIPYYELDNVVWERHKSGDIRRTEEQRKEYLEQIIQSKAWIIEGVHNEEWVSNSFYEADIILFLDPAYSIRTYRIIRRFFLQKVGVEKSHYKSTFQIFFKMFKWNKQFETVGKPNFLTNYHQLDDKIKMIRSKKDIVEVLRV